MTLPMTPLKRWPPSSSSPQYMDQGGGSRRISLSSSFSPRKCSPKSSPSSDPKDDEVRLQEARVLLFQNALKTLIKTFSGCHAPWHAGSRRVVKIPEICANCYSEMLQRNATVTRIQCPGALNGVFSAAFFSNPIVELP